MAWAAGWLALLVAQSSAGAQGSVGAQGSLGGQGSGFEQRVEKTLSQMTLDEKIGLIGGVEGFFVRGVPRLKVPRLKMSDGPVGVRNYGPTTAYPATLALAATFDEKLAERFGASIARDARSRGVHIWLAPGVNLARVPQNGRNFEYLGEDPLVAGKIASGVIRGVQSGGVVATVKHFAGNEHEWDRNRDDSVIDERTLRELYLRPFEMAIHEGGVWAVMSGYNLLNGTYCSEHEWLVNQVLKKEWGFKGIYMSDWGAAHSTDGTYVHGLDLEMPGPEYLNPRTLKSRIESGALPLAPLDDKVRRILRMTYAMEFDKRPQEDPSIPRTDPQSEATALEIARSGTVLLQNRGGLLPLKAGPSRRILVVGPNAEPAVIGGGGSAYTTPPRALSLLSAVTAAAKKRGISVAYRKGTPDPLEAVKTTELFNPDGGGGVKAEFFRNLRLEGKPDVVKVDHQINFRWNRQSPFEDFPRTNFSVRWTALYRPSTTGDHLVVARSDDGVRVMIDGKIVIDAWRDRAVGTDTKLVRFQAGREHRITVEYYQAGGDAEVQFGIQPGGWSLTNELPEQDVRSADAVILATGFDSVIETEGADRPFELPEAQQAMLAYVTKLNPRCIVVNNSGGPVDLAPFAPKLGGILQAWYPGMNGNQAVAEILFGERNPSGRLPLSWPGRLSGTYYGRAHPPVGNKVVYREGLFVGYRWYEANRQAPLFPFGYGLSYTTFVLSKPVARISGDSLLVEADVKNTGARPGTCAVQIYTGTPGLRVARPVKELRGFRPVTVAPGATTKARFSIPLSGLAYWDVETKAWVLPKGALDVYVGTASDAVLPKVRLTVK